MGRPATFSTDQLLDVAADLLLSGGTASLSAAAVARTAGAPSGSVYHRFASRDALAAALWLRTVERFDREVLAAIEPAADPVESAVTVACQTIRWSADHPVDASILTMFRRHDLIGGGAPDDVIERARALGERQSSAIASLAERLGQPADLVRFAIGELPVAATKRYLADRQPLPAWVLPAVERAVRATLDPADLAGQGRGRP